MHAYVWAYGGIFLYPSLPCCLETGSLTELELNIWARLMTSKLSESTCVHTPGYLCGYWGLLVLELRNPVLLPTDGVLLPGLWNTSL